MKTIEDAVIELGGKWPEAKFNKDRHMRLYYRSDGVYITGSSDFISIEPICTKYEFESEAKRLGYINGYRWGVEYPTNGKRPELPRDLEVEFLELNLWMKAKISWDKWYEGNTKFRIIDSRHKPADTSYLNECEYNAVADIDQLKVECMRLIDDKPVDELAVSHSSIDGIHAGDKIIIKGLDRVDNDFSHLDDEDGLDIIEKHLSKPDESLSGRAVMANEMSKLGRKAAAELADDVDNAIRESVKELINDPSNQLASNWYARGELPAEDLFIIENFKYDPDTGALFNNKTGKFIGHKIKKRDKTYLVVNIQNKRYYLHRVAWLVYYGEWPDSEIDHIDGDSENNRISNLRLSDRKSNGRNIRIDKSKSKSKFCGVNWHEKSGKWRARVKTDGKEFYLGLFDDVETAAKAVKSKRSELGFDKNHGEFRPIRTEREKVIDAALYAAIENDGLYGPLVPHINQMLERIYNAGMLVLPPKKSDTED